VHSIRETQRTGLARKIIGTRLFNFLSSLTHTRAYTYALPAKNGGSRASLTPV